MQYLGGKSYIGADIVDAMQIRGVWWEPFCGGLAVSRHLAKMGPGLCSDAHPALIAMYRAIASGWDPPEALSESEYLSARSLPDTDPLKAFAGFGCSFGGKYFGGYARQPSTGLNFAATARRVLLRDVKSLVEAGIEIGHGSFFDVRPSPGLTIYCDPPYAGTTGYALPFDSAAFWVRASEWARAGSRVFVSEYACPAPHAVVWSKGCRSRVSADPKARTGRTETLYRLLG